MDAVAALPDNGTLFLALSGEGVGRAPYPPVLSDVGMCPGLSSYLMGPFVAISTMVFT
jgi:hypothetical protein